MLDFVRQVTPRNRFIASALHLLPPGDHTDPGCRGLQLRVWKTKAGHSRTWRYRFRWQGQWVRLVLGQLPAMALAQAREKATELRSYLSRGVDPRSALPGRSTIPAATATAGNGTAEYRLENVAVEFAVRFLRKGRKRPEYAEALLRRDVIPEWMGRDIRTIKPREVIEMLDKIVDRGAPVTANRTASLAAQLFKFAVHRGLLDASPVQLLYRPGGKERPRNRELNEGELKIFLSDPRRCTRFERLERVILLLLLTGQRRGELAAAQWSEIDLQAATWTIPPENSKTGKGHIVPLSAWAVEEFKGLQREGEGSRCVLPRAPGVDSPIEPHLLTRSLDKCRKRFETLGISAFTLHDLRRTCRTGLARLGVEPHIAERVLNHAQEKIASTYDVHNYLDQKLAALDKWAAHLESLR